MDLYLGVRTCISGVRNCLLDACTCILGVVPPPCGLCACRRHFCFLKMMPLGFLNTYIVNLIDFHQFEGPLVKFSKYGQSTQMTMPARRASKFSAKRRAVLLPIFFLSLNSYVIPGNIEPWPECQPEQLVGSFFVGGGYFGLAVFAGREAWRFLTNCQTALAVSNYRRLCQGRRCPNPGSTWLG